jgi:hypothetical protein
MRGTAEGLPGRTIAVGEDLADENPYDGNECTDKENFHRHE